VPRHSLYLSLGGQWASKNLDGSEKLALGGARAVRAYPSGELLVDQGLIGTVEWRWSLNEELTPFLFYDAAHGKIVRNPTPRRRQQPQPARLRRGRELVAAGQFLDQRHAGLARRHAAGADRRRWAQSAPVRAAHQGVLTMKQRNLSRQRSHRGLQLRPLAISLLCAGLSPAIAQVLPTGFLPIAGGVTMTQSGAVMSITQPLARGIANWQTFSIGAGGVVNIVQPSASSVLLNRVTGNELSTIAGQLNANGRVILVNPNGVMFSQGATVNVGGLIASTLALTTTDQSFMDGATKLTFERADANAAAVRNLGTSPPPAAGPWC
jgi:filamentous hemagglutinin family protein